jgi:hypothetical protein
MREPKTKPTNDNVEDFLNKVENETKRNDSFKILKIMKELTQEEPVMWGASIVGFGSYHYKYTSGREGDWMIVGFSPRKQNLTLYIMDGFDRYNKILERLGKFTTGKSCLYIKKLEDVDIPTLKELISESITHVKESDFRL